MKFILEINLGNDAMQTARDIARALDKTASIVRGAFPHNLTVYGGLGIHDENGNNVGSWRVEDDKPVRRSGAERV